MKSSAIPFEMRPSNQCSKTAGEMGLSLEVRRSSRPEETSKVVKLKIPSPRPNQSLKSEDEGKIASPFDQPGPDLHHVLRQRAGDRLIFQQKTSKDSQRPWIGRKANKNDELVKHMSNLPGYLQRVEKGENVQEKALNFGVLDWDSLEKWKYKKRTPPKGNSNSPSSGSNSPFKAGGSLTLSSTVQSKSLSTYKKQSPPDYPRLIQSREKGCPQDVKQPQGKVIQQDLETASRNNLDGQRKPNRREKFSCRNHSEMMFERGKRKDSDQKSMSEKETSLTGLRKYGSSQPSKYETSAQKIVVTNRVEELQASQYYIGKKHCPGEHQGIVLLLPKHSPKKSCSEIFTSEPRKSLDRKLRGQESFSNGFSSKVHSAKRSSEIPQSCPLPIGVETNSESGLEPHSLTQAQSIGLSNDASNFTILCSDETPSVLSEGKCIDKNASNMKPSSENGVDTSKRLDHETSESAAVKGRHSLPNRRFSFSLGGIRKSLSFKESSAAAPQVSSEAHSAEFYSEIPYTCPLPLGGEINFESDMRHHRLTSDQSAQLSYDASRMFMYPNETPNTLSNANAIRTSNQLDQEAAELPAVKGKHHSPNHRFSLSLGRMGRSFSFKESSSVPQLSSTYATVKSGPVRSEMLGSLDDADRNKGNIHSRARSSPLRRLLDPLLKTRVTNRHHSDETIQSSTGNLNLTSEVISNTESLPVKKHKASTVQALLQLKIKNELPLFRLAVNNSSDILVAMKNLSAPGKDDAGGFYTFYSVREIKKKSGSWITQGHKGKGYGFGYNVVGQMKVFSSHCPDLTVQSFKDEFTQRESVLYSVDLRQTDQGSPELVPTEELCATIVKIPIGNSSDDEDQKDIGKESIGNEFLDCSQEDTNLLKNGETKNFYNTVVVLPGGVHGLPNKGAPSPLIERWKSGGSCDCGGWDIGCKLQILKSEDQNCELLGPSISCSNFNHFDLFDQEGTCDNRPIFSMSLFKKGVYSVEFSESISLLQAFSICVAVISSQKSFDFSEVNDPSETKLAQESNLPGYDRMKTPTKVRGEAPARYVPSPPPSPVGRV